MENSLLAFENENNPLKDSMKQMLEQLPHSSEQTKSIFKSLLLVHISKIKDSEERLTWQSFINTLDNMSQSEHASYSFGPYSNSEHSKDFKTYLKLKKFQTDPFEFYYETLKIKSLNSLKTFTDHSKIQKKALKKAVLVSMRLKYVEAFWKWHILSGGIENIAEEFYRKTLKTQVFSALKHNLSTSNPPHEYYKWKTTMKVLIAWAESTRDSFREKIDLKNQKNQKITQGIRPKYTQRSESAEKFIGKNKATQNFFKDRSKFVQQKKVLKKKILTKLKEKFEIKADKKKYSKIFMCWVELTKSAIFVEKMASVLSLPLLKFGFMKLVRNPISSLQAVRKKYSIDNLTDYELSVKITILERKLAGLHQELLSEQISCKSLLSEREQLLRLLA